MPVKTLIDYETALAAPDPVLALRAAVKGELAHGVDRNEVFSNLVSKMLELRAQDREADEEVVTSVMDFMEGWGSPRMAI